MSAGTTPRVLALSGGIGGAKLALGLYKTLAPHQLTVVANTADDFVHLGLHVSPDIDTLTYTLAGINNPETGWGRAGESWHFMQALEGLGGETWFSLGDKDLATNVERTRRLSLGESLTTVTARLAGALAIQARILPMSDQRVSTVVETSDGPIPFQEYFVKQQCRPAVTGFRFDGAEHALPNADFLHCLADPHLAAVIICPSNPYISVDPILSLPGIRQALADCAAPVVAVSPIIGTDSIKGPTAKMMRELGVESTAASVASHYACVIDGFVVDEQDDLRLLPNELTALSTPIMMRSLDDRLRLAQEVLQFCEDIARCGTR